MRSSVPPVLVLCVTTLLAACSGDGSAPAAAQAPSGSNSAPTVSVVGAAATGAVLVGWTPPQQNTDDSMLTDLAGYRVYWGTSPQQLFDSATIRTSGVTSHIVEPLPPGKYYFAVTAFNEQNVESELSEAVAADIR